MLGSSAKRYLESSHKLLEFALSHAKEDGDKEATEDIQTALNLIRGHY